MRARVCKYTAIKLRSRGPVGMNEVRVPRDICRETRCGRVIIET